MSEPHLKGTKPMQGDGRPPPLRAIVRVLNAPAEPSAFLLERGVCVIGSAPESDIVVSEPTVSRSHAALSLSPDGVVVQDLKSRNGTFYLGQRVERMVLGFGGHVQAGQAKVQIELDTEALFEGLEYEGEVYRGVLGASAAMRRVFAVALRLESSLVPVLLEGESGVGKEAIARAIHEGSGVSGAMVALNCGAIPRDLVASELFGHRRGAFTGAAETRRGAFESASGGTLFLDEIGELPLDVQPMLLRVLETGEVRAVGEDEPKRVKVRVIAATNRDLEREAVEGRFREDLFYRLAVVRINIPPLRERGEDVTSLAAHFAAEAGLEKLPPAIVDQLRSRSWPGNARELRNAVQAYAALGVLPKQTRSRPAILDLALRDFVQPKVDYAAQKAALIERFTAVYLEALLETAGGNHSVAAKMSGLDRGYFGRLLAKHGLLDAPDRGKRRS